MEPKPHKEMVLKEHGFSSPLTLVNPKGFHQNASINYNYYSNSVANQISKKQSKGDKNNSRWKKSLQMAWNLR